MAKGMNQKLKLIRLMQIMLEQTDDEHSLTMKQILIELQRYGITAERKSIYADMEALRLYGMDIIGEKRDKTYYYHVGSRQFELAELKLLVDAVQSSKFITEKKSRKLIKKLESFLSRYEAKKLQRQVFVSGRIKTMNESIYYNVDMIHEAIASNVKIKFKYYNWDVDKKMVLRHGGDYFLISPWGLLWDNENYYLIGYDSITGIIKHYRVDKMMDLCATEDRREGREYFKEYDMVVYTRKHFGMFDGKEERVKIEFENYFAGVVIDRFGKDVIIRKSDEEHFIVAVDVAVSEQFLGWLFALGSGARIIGPENVVGQMKEQIRKQSALYD
ncbi:MAG: WYL domain-containing protein [Bacteroidales bacterium]|nr:WYL domain-containing protein [Clostridium sp.]MCM1204780.1 WYL domain-containing protein [Bacteroidales bacterium]